MKRKYLILNYLKNKKFEEDIIDNSGYISDKEEDFINNNIDIYY